MTDNTHAAAPTWEQSVIQALQNLGGEGHFSVLYPEVRKLRWATNVPLSCTWRGTVRRECQKSKFITQDVKRSGVWHLVK